MGCESGHDGTGDDFGCRIKHVQVSAAALPTRRNNAAPKPANPVWERGIVTQQRPDGSQMPYLDEKNNPIRVRQFQDRRHEFETRIKELKKPNP